jgi:hypothetical protein
MLGTRENEPSLPGALLAAAGNRGVMDQSVFSEIIGLPQASLAPEQLGRAERRQGFGEQRLGVKAGVAAMAQPNGKIDLVALEVGEPDRR